MAKYVSLRKMSCENAPWVQAKARLRAAELSRCVLRECFPQCVVDGREAVSSGCVPGGIHSPNFMMRQYSRKRNSMKVQMPEVADCHDQL